MYSYLHLGFHELYDLIVEFGEDSLKLTVDDILVGWWTGQKPAWKTTQKEIIVNRALSF